MRRLLKTIGYKASLLSLLLSLNVYADAPSEAVLAHCTGISEMAKSTMDARQQEVSMSKLMVAMKSPDANLNNLISEIIKDAYKAPAYGGKEYRDKESRRFENKWFAFCLKIMGKS